MISGLYTALSGMNAHRKILDVTAHNVSNQATPGYRRQRVDLAPSGIGPAAAVWAGPGSQLQGVDVVDTRRVMDDIAEGRAARELALTSDAFTMSSSMQRIEAAFPEPSERGLASQLDAFWSSWGDLANRPDDVTARAAVLGRAENLTQSIGQAAVDLDKVVETSTERLARIADEVNDLAGRIAALNQSAANASAPANDILDQRDRLMTELTQLTGAVARPGDGDQINVDIGGRALISGPFTERVAASGGSLVWERGGDTVRTPPSEAAALSRVISDVVPTYRAELDTITATLVDNVNTLHTTGYDLDGNTGLNFFDPAGTTAATIALSADVADQPRALAAGAPAPGVPGPFDGGMADQLAQLVDSPTGADANYRTFVAGLGIDTRDASRRADTQQMMADQAIDDAQSVSGVSLDEEMVNLIQAQRGYEASARVLTAIDQMLGTIIERTGLVGR
ncbi:MAG: flagellar hook-associated protein FlgK [Ilumatobacter sp.]|jgi:flagellar hook-associated protein 1|uniref:flagellar hook-associated protein FlgK n=1 Tax=Ilumatobacter sp. TaxID=1967498 RepID=UPI00391C85D7